MALFGSTGLPIIVAVTSVAVSAGQMTATNASVLVAGGAVTVLVCPLLAQRLLRARTSRADLAVGRVRGQHATAEPLGVRDHCALGEEQVQPAAYEHERWLAVLAQVTGQASYEGQGGVLGDAHGVGEQSPAAALADDLLGEDPLGHEVRRPAELEHPVTRARAGRDVVDRRVGAARAAQLLDGLDGRLVVPRPGSSQSTIGSPPARSSRGSVGSSPSL